VTVDREEENTAAFRLWKKQLYHETIAHILEPLRQAMSTPEIVLCPDRLFRKVIYEIGPFIADYPEQVLLAGVVQNWCPKLATSCFDCRMPLTILSPDACFHRINSTLKTVTCEVGNLTRRRVSSTQTRYGISLASCLM
jgi:hypothetical protein